MLIGCKTFFFDVKWIILSCFATDLDKTGSQVPSIMYHSMDMELWPCVSVLQKILLTGTGGLLNGVILCCVSCIFSVKPHLVASIAQHALTFAPVFNKTVPG